LDCVVVVLFVPSLCDVVVLLLDCPVAGFDVEELFVVLFGSDVDVLLSVWPPGCCVVVVLEFVCANTEPEIMRPIAVSAAKRDGARIFPPN
jgi:hypothetical protein